MFTTHASTGAPVAPSSAFEAADVKIYKNGNAAEKTTTNGVTMTSPFDSVTGLHCVTIDTSNDTGDGGFWVTGAVYTLVLSPDETVDSVAVAKVIGQFGIVLAGAAASVPTAAQVADAVWDEARSGHVTSGTFGEGVASVQGNVTGSVASVSGSVASVTGAVGSVTGNVGGNVTGSIGSLATQAKADVNAEADAALADVGLTTIITGRIDVAVSSRLASASYTVPLDAAGIRSAVGLASANLDTQIDALPTADENADALLDRDMSSGSDNGSTTVRTPRQALRFLRNKWSISGTTLTVTKENDTTASWTAAITQTPGADPITASDPAGP
jgi:hypothetical protein